MVAGGESASKGQLSQLDQVPRAFAGHGRWNSPWVGGVSRVRGADPVLPYKQREKEDSVTT